MSADIPRPRCWSAPAPCAWRSPIGTSPYLHHRLAHLYGVTPPQLRRSGDTSAIQVRPIGAAEIVQGEAVLGGDQPEMELGSIRVVDDNIGFGATADHRGVSDCEIEARLRVGSH